jgi:hypothetical protein
MEELARNLADYIRSERDRLLPLATPLLAVDRTALERSFELEFLDGVRVAVGVQLREPTFLSPLQSLGLHVPSVSVADAVTLVSRAEQNRATGRSKSGPVICC